MDKGLKQIIENNNFYLCLFVSIFHQGINTYNAYMKYPVIMNELKQLEQQLSGGTTATVVVIFNNKIFVANVGM